MLVELGGLDKGDGYRGDDAVEDVDEDARGKPVPLASLPGLKTGVRALRNSVYDGGGVSDVCMPHSVLLLRSGQQPPDRGGL